MRRKRRLEITVETRQRLLIKRAGRAASPRCAECGGQMIKPGEATLNGVSAHALHLLAEHRGIHFAETPEGLLLICLDSLLARG